MFKTSVRRMLCYLQSSFMVTSLILFRVALVTWTCLPSAVIAGYCSKPHLELTLSPTSGTVEVSWDLEDWVVGDRISVYLGNVISRPDTILPVTTLTADDYVGWKDTGVPYSVSALNITSYKRQCLTVYALYWRPTGSKKDSIVATCLQTLPDWMGHYRGKLGGMHLMKLFIPGTHNSAAYKTKYTFWLLDAIKAMYLFNQDLSVLQQLILGSRYVDLRVQRDKRSPSLADEDWVLVHGSYRLVPVIDVLNDILSFLNNTEYEVVVVDVHRFSEDMTNQDILDFAHYLESHLSLYWATPKHGLTWQSPLQDFWTQRKRLVVAYNDINLVFSLPSQFMMPVAQLWVNKQTIQDMENTLRPIYDRLDDYEYYMDYESYYESNENKSKPHNVQSTLLSISFGWAVMAQMTLEGSNFLLHPTQSLRKNAAEINPWLSRWFRRFGWGQRLCNIVAVDFLAGTGIVRAAVDFNLMRASGDECYSYEDYRDGYTQTVYKP